MQYHKKSTRDVPRKCDAFSTGSSDDCVWGSIDRLTETQFDKLDGFEGSDYRRVDVTVLFEGKPDRAVSYTAKPSVACSGLWPFDRYMELVLSGAREFNLAEIYIDGIDAIPAMPESG